MVNGVCFGASYPVVPGSFVEQRYPRQAYPVQLSTAKNVSKSWLFLCAGMQWVCAFLTLPSQLHSGVSGLRLFPKLSEQLVFARKNWPGSSTIFTRFYFFLLVPFVQLMGRGWGDELPAERNWRSRLSKLREETILYYIPWLSLAGIHRLFVVQYCT